MAGFTACGKVEDKTTEAETEAATEATTEAAADTTEAASAGDSDSDSSATVDGKKVETPLANVTYDDKIWTLDEENKTDNSLHRLFYPLMYSASLRTARARWLMSFFTSTPSSANVSPVSSGMKTGS